VTSPKRSGSPSDLHQLLKGAEQAGPAHRIEFRDRIAAHGLPAIEAVAPWLADPTYAAFAIRVIERVGHNGERDAATDVLRGARRVVDPQVRPDLDWALVHLRVPADPAVAQSAPPAAQTRVARIKRPLGAGRVAGVSRRSVPARTLEPS